MRNPLTTRTAKSARTRRSLTLLGVLILLVLAGWAVVASAGPKVATPTITAGPSGSTSAVTATFAFVAGARGDTLECSLDGAPYAACTSPTSYSGLANGTHAFGVRERNPRLGAGDAATRTWTVDTIAPPAPQITQAPANPSNSSAASFSFADAESHVAFVCQLDGGTWTACSSPTAYKKLADGTHAFGVKARDAAGNLSTAATYGWRVDTVAPPKPTLTQTPPNPSASSSATFAFTDAEAGAGFQCSLDNAAFASCTSLKAYASLANGGHTFVVRAVDAAGNRSASTSYGWRVIASTTGLPFTISGGYGGLLYPGKTGDLSLRISNPNGVAIYVASLTVTIQPGSSNAGCDGPANLTVRPSSVSSTNLLAVPANGSVTLPSGTVSAPQVTMLDLATNQDACKGAVYTFAYGGSSHS